MSSALTPEPLDASTPEGLRSYFAAARGRAAELLANGDGGVVACEYLARAYDVCLEQLFTCSAARHEVNGIAVALVATGGWGRREVCPNSDIDFIIVTEPQSVGIVQRWAQNLLYPLWDAGFDVGHSVWTIDDAVRLAKEDVATAAALIDARHIVGNSELADQLACAARRVTAPGGNANGFVSMLRSEMRRRHERYVDSVYLLEPNLKQGLGALRDLATGIWAARARWAVRELHDLVGHGLLTARQVGVLEQAREFLLELRSLLHLHAGRGTDRLTFEIQEAIAPGLCPNVIPAQGDIRPAVAPSVEALMRRYYRHARGVAQVTDYILELAEVAQRRKPHVSGVDASFVLFNGRLGVWDPAVFRDKPAELVRVFAVAAELEVPIYSHTKQLIAEVATELGARLADDNRACQYFLKLLLAENDAPRDALSSSQLELMHQLGVLNAVMPEFAPCTCRVQHDLYHVYTVDQHQLYALAMLKRLARGELRDLHPHATDALAQVGDRRALYLAMLLHDVGKPLGKGHAESGARLAGRVARRLRYAPGQVARVEFLVRQHLTMSHLSQRRDLSDPAVIARFAKRVGTIEALSELFVLTLCDTAMTAPGNLSAWKLKLLVELYQQARLVLGGESAPLAADPEQRSEVLRARALKLAGDRPALAGVGGVAGFLERLADPFVASLSPRQLARHVALAEEFHSTQALVVTRATCYQLKGHTELAVIAADRPGLLAQVAGVLAVHRVNVLGAMGSQSHGLACDLFYVRDLVGAAIGDDSPKWERIERDLLAVVNGDLLGDELTRRVREQHEGTVLSQRVTPTVITEVRVESEESPDYSIIEVVTEDRLGVLHLICRTLSEQLLDIHITKIATEGARVADVFYVTERATGGKIADEARQREIVAMLHTALSSGEPPGA